MGSQQAKDVEIPEQYEVHFLEMSDGVKLRCLSYTPENPKGHVYMFPGMVTLVMSWIRTLELLAELQYEVHYVESREKHTSINPDNIGITYDRMIADCGDSARVIGFKDEEFIAIGSSLGSNTIIHSMARNDLCPKHAILVGPNPNFTVPRAIMMLMPFTNYWTYNRIGKPLIMRVAMRKFTDEESDPYQKLKYKTAILLADPVRIKKSLRAWRGKPIWDDLSKIDGTKTKCYLIGASEDKLHPDERTRKVAEQIDNALFVDLKTNSAAHDKPLIDLIESFKI